jgi:transposase-like protein
MVQVNIKRLIDDVQCYQTIRELRWPDGMTCPACQSTQVIKRGFDDTEPARQRYEWEVSLNCRDGQMGHDGHHM